jgi:uncharacterized protein
VDTNILISSALFPASVPNQALAKALSTGQLLISEAVLAEVIDVLARPKFDHYLSIESRQNFLDKLIRISKKVIITHTVTACRDAKDNMILELALSGKADFILTGDRDLLALSSFQGIPIWTPAHYLTQGE